MLGVCTCIKFNAPHKRDNRQAQGPGARERGGALSTATPHSAQGGARAHSHGHARSRSRRATRGPLYNPLLRGSREEWARAFWPRLMNRSFFGLLRPSLLRPSTPFFGTCFVWQQRGAARQVGLTRSTAYARPAGAVTASHWRCDCDRSRCAPESRLWAVCREERLMVKCRSTCRSSALPR